MPRTEYQQNLPVTEVLNRSREAAMVAKRSSEGDSSAIASELFDRALDAAGLTNAEAAYLLGLSEGLVRRMRSPNDKQCVSLIQMVKLGPRFLWEFHRALHATCKFGRQALGETVNALSLLAVGIE